MVIGHCKMHKLSFACDICANTFPKNGHLKMHNLPFTCDIFASIFPKI